MSNPDLKQSKALQRQSLREFVRWMSKSSPGAQLFESRGIEASIVPATPDRSIPNSVVYESVDALDRGLQKLDAAYKRLDVKAWTVWVPEDDKEAIAMLGDARLIYDGDPAAMQLSLKDFEPPDPGDLVWDSACTTAQCAAINDDAYGLNDEKSWGPAMSEPTDRPLLRLYRAKLGGKPVCTLGTIDSLDGTDLGIYFVATKRKHQGKGLMTRLLGQALAEAQERGVKTSSLQASAEGEAVYSGLGYKTAFRWHMYERRVRPPIEPKRVPQPEDADA
jgi:GNAT superfamily N-acetyltransferase